MLCDTFKTYTTYLRIIADLTIYRHFDDVEVLKCYIDAMTIYGLILTIFEN